MFVRELSAERTTEGDRMSSNKNLVLIAMVFAVGMTFIDQTIVSIAAPNIQRELGLTNTGMQWAINAYLLSLAAFFAFGGRLSSTPSTESRSTLCSCCYCQRVQRAST